MSATVILIVRSGNALLSISSLLGPSDTPPDTTYKIKWNGKKGNNSR